MDLNEWVLILNRMDEFLEQTIARCSGMWLPEKTDYNLDLHPAPVEKTVFDSIATILKFSSSLLKSCYNKEIYSSTEVRPLSFSYHI